MCACALPVWHPGKEGSFHELRKQNASVEAGLEERGTADEKIGQRPSSSHSVRAPDVTRHGVKHGNS